MNSAVLFFQAVECVRGSIADGKNTLVHCVAGRSRSAAVVVCAIRDFRKISWCEAYDLVASGRDEIRIHPAFAEFIVSDKQ